ncbi:hypothetical protein SAMN05216428_10195 [Nitrosospira sp. Nsp11]|uniref:hypothetical protein n=1 Tax=Nitrosospira sp. Nsp11 TaxID=1855338 RepID=UPI0009132AC4|nr:hypothetical protein [Nitrosospira sp. Nsp11]SHL10753.1 hypothetical protein SAMN05216428_10195 [Nitrosospira sp. Nsp11]
MNQYYVCWWSKYSYGVGVDGFESAVIMANSDIEAKGKIEKEHNCVVNGLIDVRIVTHPLNNA